MKNIVGLACISGLLTVAACNNQNAEEEALKRAAAMDSIARQESLEAERENEAEMARLDSLANAQASADSVVNDTVPQPE